MRIIWALFDNRAGNNSQTLGLAKALNENYLIKNVNYTKLATLPNYILGKSIYRISKKSRMELQAPYPDIVITTGRKLSSVARCIKSLNPKTKIIQLMWPEAGICEFDLIVLPKHDKRPEEKNVIVTTGSIHKIDEEVLSTARTEFIGLVKNLPEPYISVLIGGNTKFGKFTLNDANILVDKINSIRNKIGGTILLTTSRRTDQHIISYLQKNIAQPSYIYDYETSAPNPYMALLALADILIVTGDSISMASEACYTGKPVYIYANKNFCAKKHLLFHQQLYDLNLAKNLSDIDRDNLYWEYTPLDEAKRIACYVKDNIINVIS